MGNQLKGNFKNVYYEDGSIRSIEKLDKGLLDAVQDNLIDIINSKEMKLLKDVSDDNLIWEDIKQI